MKQGRVFNNNNLAGIISKLNDGSFTFEYDHAYLQDVYSPAISLTMPKVSEPYKSKNLFPFFFSLLSEGSNKKLQSKILKIDEEDYFEFLLKTANHETIGAIRIEEVINA